MTEPMTMDIPHQLGKAGARERLDRGIGKITSIIPGGGQVRHDWDGDRMNFTISAMGQKMTCRATIFDAKVHAEVDLPPMLAMFAGKVRETLGRELPKLLK